MSDILSPPIIDGLDEVEHFATEHGLTNALGIASEILGDVYSLARRIWVEHYTDPEDGHESLFFVVSGAPQTTDQEVESYFQWNRRICESLGPEELYRIGMYREYTE